MSAASLSAPATLLREMGLARRLVVLALPLVLAGYFGLALAHSLATPILEGPDEGAHLSYINHLVAHRELPLLARAIHGDPWERFQPPLYYAAMAALLAALHGGPLDLPLEKNPKFYVEGGNSITRFLHQPGALRSTEASAFHALRALQIIFGVLTICFTYRIASVILGRERALAAPVAMAGLPQFLHISAMLNNDNLANCLSALALWLLLKTWRKGNSGCESAAVIGLVLGAALLTKLTTVFLLPVAGVVLAMTAGAGRRRWAPPALALAVAGALGGWFLPLLATVCGKACSPGLTGAGADLVLSWEFCKLVGGSFTGHFGWMAIPLERAPQAGLCLLWVAGVGSAVWVLVRRRAPRSALLVAGATMLALAQFLFFAWFYGIGQGRYLFVALPQLATLWALGLGGLFRRAGYLLPVLGLALLSSNTYVLVRLLPRLGMP